MVNLPANPGEALWIGGAAGKNHFNIGIGGPNGGTDHTDYTQAQIEDGFDQDPEFVLNSDGDIQFRMFVENGRTSSGTKYPRSELREFLPNGTTRAAWDGRSGTHYMQGRSRIDTAPSAKPWVVFFQVHDSESDLARVQLEAGNIVCRRTPPGGDEIRTVLRSGYSFGTWIEWELRIESGRLTIKLDGETELDVTGMGTTGCYFKTGCYNQVSSADDGGGATPGEYCQVTMQRGSLVVWHTGYAPPTTPVFTGSTDTSGGAGSDPEGNDTQAPTAPTGLTTVPEGSGIRLTWNESTDNVGVDHYNVYRFATDAVGGGSSGGSTSTIGKTDAGSSSSTSTNDKLIGSVGTASANGTLAAGHARVWLDASGSTTSRMLVYADSSGSPGALLATSDEITITATSESTRDYVFSGAEQIDIETGVDYWVTVAWNDPGAIDLRYSRGGVSSSVKERSDITYGTFPDPFGSATGTFSGPLDAWVEVVSGGSPGGGGTTSSFGKQTDGASTTSSSADKMIVSAATASADGTLEAGHARIWLDGADTVPTKCVVYADSSGAPGAQLAVSDEVNVTGTSEAEVDYTFSGAEQISITNGTTYWIGVAWQDPGAVSIVYSRDGTSSMRQEVSGFTYPTLPDPFGTPTPGAGPIDVYLDTSSGSSASGAFVLIATTTQTTYLDTDVDTQTPSTLGVGGIAAPAAGEGVVLITSDSSSRLTCQGNTIYDGGGNTVAGITIEEDNVTVQNFVITGADRDGVAVRANNVTVRNCDFYGISDEAEEDINAITFFGNGFRMLFNTIGVTDFLVSGDPGGSHTDAVQTWNNDPGESSSNVIIQGNYIKGPATSDVRFIHQGVQAQGKGATDGGGGGTGTSTNWLIADNTFEMSSENQIIKLEDIDDVDVTRNVFIGESSNAFDIRASSTNVTVYDDNDFTAFTGDLPSLDPGPGPAGVTGGSLGGTPVEYTYKVTAEDAAGNESGGTSDGGGTDGGTVGAVVPDDEDPPSVPTNLAATVDDRRVSLTWDVSTDDDTGVDEYYVYRDGVFWVRAVSPEYVDTDVANGTEYSYTVSALDRAGNESDECAAVLATPAAVAVGGVTFLPGRLVTGQRVNAGLIEVSVAWGADLADDQSTWDWTDITTDVRHDPGISTSLGRNDESSSSNPAALTLQLDNTSGGYSLGGLSSNHPYVRRNTPVRVRIDPGDGVGGRVLFFGFADGWSPGWDLTGTVPVVTLSASGSLRRMSQGDAPVQSAYRRAMTALDSVVAYWPMEEGSASRYAPAVRGGSDMALSGRPDWGADDNLECSAPLPVLKDGHFSADVHPYTDNGKSQVRFLVSIPSDGLPDGIVLLRVSTNGSISRWDVTYEIVNGKDNLGIYRYASDGSLNSSDIINFDVNGLAGRVTLALAQNGSNVGWMLGFKDDDPDNSLAYTFSGIIASHTIGVVTHVDVNPNGAEVEAAIGHVTVEDTITSLFEAGEALIAYTGEIATGVGGRIYRLCSENGVPLQTYGAPGPGSSVADALGPQLVAPLLELLFECEASDQGQLWDGRNAGLSYSTRRRRELGTVKLTVDAAAGELAESFEPVDDDQRNRNRMQVTRSRGITVTHEDTDGPLGTAAIGIYDDSVTINNRRDEMMAQYATWYVHLGTVDGYRYPSLTVDLAATPDLAPEVLDIVPGERIDVVNLDDTLAGFPDDSVSLIVEGISHELTTRTWRATFQCSPASPWLVGEVCEDSADTTELAWRLDTDGATLASSAAAGATSISVATSSGALWTTDSDDYPLYLSVGGLRVRATACSGSSSPQTFTVDALGAARSSGATVALWDPRPIGLG